MSDPMNWGFCLSEYNDKDCSDCLSQKECVKMIENGKREKAFDEAKKEFFDGDSSFRKW